MKSVAFLQDLDISRGEATAQLAQCGCILTPVWLADETAPVSPDDVEVLVTKEHHVQRAELEPYPNLRMVSLAFTGFNDVALDYADSRGVHVYFVPGYATASVAELIVLLTLSILRKLPKADQSVRAGRWHHDVYPGIELHGKTVGIAGTGTIGCATARRFKAMECEVRGFSRTTNSEFTALGGAYVSREELFRESDIVTLCLVSNKDTEGFVGEAELSWMKDGGVLINTARANLIQKKPLLAALRDRKIRCGIDVYENEPAASSKTPFRSDLFGFDNVVVTPHIGFKTVEALQRLSAITITNVGRFLRGDSTNRLVPKP